MNKEAMKLALEAGAIPIHKDYKQQALVGNENIERFAELVRADEREACAKLCETEWSNVAERIYGEECAVAIRARGNT